MLCAGLEDCIARGKIVSAVPHEIRGDGVGIEIPRHSRQMPAKKRLIYSGRFILATPPFVHKPSFPSCSRLPSQLCHSPRHRPSPWQSIAIARLDVCVAPIPARRCIVCFIIWSECSWCIGERWWQLHPEFTCRNWGGFWTYGGVILGQCWCYTSTTVILQAHTRIVKNGQVGSIFCQCWSHGIVTRRTECASLKTISIIITLTIYPKLVLTGSALATLLLLLLEKEMKRYDTPMLIVARPRES